MERLTLHRLAQHLSDTFDNLVQTDALNDLQRVQIREALRLIDTVADQITRKS